MSTIVRDAHNLADLLESAERYGVPMPFAASAYDYRRVGLIVRTSAEWDAWRSYLDGDTTLTVAGDDTQLVLTGTAYECSVEVRVVLQEGEPSRHLAALLGEEHIARAADLGVSAPTPTV